MSEKLAKSILVTGATGVVGSALLPRLADFNIVALLHEQRSLTSAARCVYGDVTKPRLGLEYKKFRALARRIDGIVHSAALTRFTLDSEGMDQVNVAGTDHVLELASLAQAPLYYVSTAFVARSARMRKSGGVAAYVNSKLTAEEHVRRSGLDAVVIRPSVLIGDSNTGEISQFQGLHMLAGSLLRNSLPLLPVGPNVPVDFLPQDIVAQCIADIVRRGETRGEYWLTAGASALTMARVIELCMELGRDLRCQPVAPRLVTPDVVDRLIRPVFIQPLPHTAQKHFNSMLDIMVLFHNDEPFTSSLADLGRPISSDQLERAFVRSMLHWADKKELINRRAIAL